MRCVAKMIVIIPLIVLFLVFSGALALLPAGPIVRRRLLVRNTSLFSRFLLMVLGVRVRVRGHRRLVRSGPGLIVANHVSYIDVLVLASLAPAAFVTSVELRGLPLLGLLARLGGSVFVERRRPQGLLREIARIARLLGAGIPVTLFPEGTTSNGDRVQPFKVSLFAAAVQSTVPVRPVCLRYVRVNGVRPDRTACDAVFYYGGITFFRHLPRFLALKSVVVEVVPLTAIPMRAGFTRKDAAQEAHRAVSDAYAGSGPPPGRNP